VTEPTTGNGIRVYLDGEGKWGMSPWDRGPNRTPYAGPVAHRAVRPGNQANALLVVVRGRDVEVYVNGEGVCERVRLDRDITPGMIGLAGRADWGKVRLELERLTVWSAERLPRRAWRRGKR
jgi:hypothetical protein